MRGRRRRNPVSFLTLAAAQSGMPAQSNPAMPFKLSGANLDVQICSCCADVGHVDLHEASLVKNDFGAETTVAYA